VSVRWKHGAKAALTFSFDDGYKQTYEFTTELLTKFGLRATYNIPVSYVGDWLEGLIVASWGDWQKAAGEAMEIASHSVTHKSIGPSFMDNTRRFINSYWHEQQRTLYLKRALKCAFSSPNKDLSDKKALDIANETIGSKEEICAQIPSCEVSSYVYPYGACNSYYEFAVKSAGYSSARSLDRGCNQYDLRNFFALKCMLWNQDMTVEVANKWVDYAIKEGGWLIETCHLVAEDNPTSYPDYTSVSDFKRHLDYIRSQNVWVDTQQNIVRYIQEKRC